MSITNAERHDLHKALEELLGEQRANILMEHLPPVGWADVATKRDLDHLGDSLRKDLGLRIAELRHDIASQQLRHTIALVGILGTLMAVVNAVG
jgi:hypothetical protein